MSELYSIQDTTLTALGDAIRNKVIGISKAPAPINKDNVSIGPYSLEVIEFPSGVKTVKVSGHINEYESSISENTILYTLGYASGVYTRARDIRSATDFTIINPNWDGVGYDFEITVKGNAVSFTTGQDYNSWGASSTYDYTAVGLDENGNEFKYTPLEMVDKINALEIPNIQPLVLTGDCSYSCGGIVGNKYIELFGNTITTKDITNAKYMFQYSKLTSIPFDINFSSTTQADASYLFYASDLITVPKINNLYVTTLRSIFQFLKSLREIPDDITNTWDFSVVDNATNAYSYEQNGMFEGCYSLRKYANTLLTHGNPVINYSYSIYTRLFNNCYVLDEVVNLPFPHYNANWTSNAFSYTFDSCGRLKEIIFAVQEDGSPYIMKWRGQTIDLSKYVGYLSQGWYVTAYNSGITADKEVFSDATYQALKNDPDWYTANINYSRYNHDSAVNTINSLPDCSATGTNTIKFSGASGALTDGGAINTLTEEEIAVATAKGWTVTLS